MIPFVRISLLLTLPVLLWAEGVSWNIGLQSNAGRGQQLGIPYNYTENFITGSLEQGPWFFDLRFEYSAPPEYGPAFLGMDRLLARYTSDNWTLEAGDILALFGRGLALNLYEDQTIDFDSGIKGVRLTANILQDHEIDLIAGVNNKYRFYSPGSELRRPDGNAEYTLGGIQTDFNSSSGTWNVAPYLIGSRMSSGYLWPGIDPLLGRVVQDTVNQVQHIVQAGWSQSFYGEAWDVFLEYNRTWKAFDYPLLEQTVSQADGAVAIENDVVEYAKSGRALDLQLNWFPQWGSATFEYRRYLNGPERLSEKRDPLLLASKPLPWQLGPTGIRQHDISLLANVTHPTDYGDELGWALELRRNFSYDWSLMLNAAQISLAHDVEDPQSSAGILPARNIRRNPWQEYYAELEYNGNELSQRMLIAYTRSILGGHSSAEIKEHFTFVPAYLSWYARSNVVLSTLLELQHSRVTGETYDALKLPGHQYDSFHLITSIDLLQRYSASVVWDSSDDPNLNDGRSEFQHWVSGELSMKPLDGLWIRTAYGKEKGGIRCTGGVCRVINPFEGFRLTVEWRL